MENHITKNRTAILAIVLMSYLMIVLDISFVITALPKIQEELLFSPTGISWVQNIYTLVFGGLLLLGARAGDILGQRRMFLYGLTLFTLASLAIGLAQDSAWMLAARTIQGIGAAILAPTELALLSTNFPEGPDRTHALAYYGAVAGVGASLGFVIGGSFAGWLSWRGGFFLNFAIGIVLFLAARRYIVETERRSGEFDIVGAFTSTLGMISLSYGIVRSVTAGWGDRFTIMAVASGLVLVALFVFNEWRARQPIMPLRLFASRERSGAFIARMLYMGAMTAFWFFTTQFLQKVAGMTPFEAGIAFLPMSLVNFAVAVIVPQLTRQFGNAWLLTFSIAITLIGMLWLSHVSADTPYLTGILLPMVLLGIGQGGALSPLTVAGLSGVPREDAGAASGLVNVAHRVGGSLGLAILVVIFSTAGAGISDTRQLLTHRFSAALNGGAVMLVLTLCAVITLILLPKKIFRKRQERASMPAVSQVRPEP